MAEHPVEIQLKLTGLAQFVSDVQKTLGKVHAGFERAKAGVVSFNQKVSNAAKGMMNFGTIMKAALPIYLISQFTKASAEQERATIKLNDALKKTGQYTPEATAAIQKYASELQRTTTHGDDLYESGAALLVNLGKLSADQLPAAMRAAAGFADTIEGMDLTTAFSLITKSAAGQNQLWSRYGLKLDLTKSKQEVFNQVLAEGNKHFRTSQALTTGNVGAAAQFANIWGDVKERLGDFVYGILVPMMKLMKPILLWFNDMSTGARTLAVSLGLVSVMLWKGIIPAMQAFGVTSKAALGWIGLIIGALTLLVLNWDAVKKAVGGVLESLGLIPRQIGVEYEKANSKIATLTKSIYDQEHGVGPLIATYKKLTAEGIKPTVKQKEELRKTLDKIQELMPEIISGYDKEGKAIGLNLPLYRESLELKRQELLLLTRDRRVALEKDIAAMEKSAATMQEKTIPQTEQWIEDLGKLDASGQKVWGDIPQSMENATGKMTALRTELAETNKSLAMSKAELAGIVALGDKLPAYVSPPVTPGGGEAPEESDAVAAAEIIKMESLANKIRDLRIDAIADTFARQRAEVDAAFEDENEVNVNLLKEKRLNQDEYMTWFAERDTKRLRDIQTINNAELAAKQENAEKTKEIISDVTEFQKQGQEAMAAGWDGFYQSVTQKGTSAADNQKALVDAVKSHYINAIGAEVKAFLFGEATKEATSKKGMLSIIADNAKVVLSNLATAASSIVSAVASGFKWLVSKLGPFGLAAGIALGVGIIAAFGKLKKTMGFAKGGAIVGEEGKPEIIAPVREFADYSGQIASAVARTIANTIMPLAIGRDTGRADSILGMIRQVSAQSLESIKTNIAIRDAVTSSLRPSFAGAGERNLTVNQNFQNPIYFGTVREELKRIYHDYLKTIIQDDEKRTAK